MTRKKCIKKLMALGQPRNIAEKQADLVKLTGNYNSAYKLCCHILLGAVEQIKV